MKKRYIIVNKFRFISFLTISILLSSFLINILFFSNKVYSSTRDNYKMICIEKGDTLWDIATEYNTKNIDIRQVVLDIKELNNLGYRLIYPGDLIKVPIY